MDAVVLGLGDDGVGTGDIPLLLTRNDGHGHLGGQVGILTEGLLGAAPAGISGHIQVGCQNLLVTQNAGLGGDAVAHLPYQLGIKGLGQRQGNGENGGAVEGHTVEGLRREDGGDTQAGALHQALLHLIFDRGDGIDIVEIADTVVPYVLVEFFRHEDVVGLHRAGVAVRQGIHMNLHPSGDIDLTDLLLQRHTGEQITGALLGGESRILVVFHR